MPPEEDAIALLNGMFLKNASPAAEQVRLAVEDGYKRLLEPSIETEARLEAKQRADAEAIRVFAANLRELLLAPPLGGKTVLGIDPGFRTGCKVVCLDRQGKLLHHDVIFIEQSDRQRDVARQTVLALCQRFQIEAIAIGNGTASRETEAFVRGLDLPPAITVVMVNESGASVYSASEARAREFPDQDITVRGAVSIGRRLMDPLAELVKIDPKSIGVGQYQHDVDQKALKRSLDEVVVSCVNAVGVEVNTASKQLLSYVSGLNGVTAANIVAPPQRARPVHVTPGPAEGDTPGPEGLRAGGRIPAHPRRRESARRQRRAPGKLRRRGTHGRRPRLHGAGPHDPRGPARPDPAGAVRHRHGRPADAYRTSWSELAKPGRDPRQQFEAFAFAEGVTKLEDLQPGMKLPGIVTNVTAFGAFVDIGVHQDGLVHVSQLADRFVKEPADVVKVHQRVQVTVLEVDLARKRIGLSMKRQPDPDASRTSRGAPADASRRPSPAAPRTQGAAAKPANDWFSLALRKAAQEKAHRDATDDD